ncbi:hypothetical protein GCM10022140_35360 [Rhodococcus aetherivorans]
MWHLRHRRRSLSAFIVDAPPTERASAHSADTGIDEWTRAPELFQQLQHHALSHENRCATEPFTIRSKHFVTGTASRARDRFHDPTPIDHQTGYQARDDRTDSLGAQGDPVDCHPSGGEQRSGTFAEAPQKAASGGPAKSKPDPRHRQLRDSGRVDPHRSSPHHHSHTARSRQELKLSSALLRHHPVGKPYPWGTAPNGARATPPTAWAAVLRHDLRDPTPIEASEEMCTARRARTAG